MKTPYQYWHQFTLIISTFTINQHNTLVELLTATLPISMQHIPSRENNNRLLLQKQSHSQSTFRFQDSFQYYPSAPGYSKYSLLSLPNFRPILCALPASPTHTTRPAQQIIFDQPYSTCRSYAFFSVHLLL